MLTLHKVYSPSSLGYLSLLVIHFISSNALRVDPSSRCAAACSPSNSTTSDDVVCYDYEFTGTSAGSKFQECVECELGSTDVDSSTGMTDVLWGLYNLRFAVSTCIYGFPEAKTSLSTPCQVSCASLAPAIEYNLNNSESADLSFCNQPRWADVIINKCVYCYNWTSSERYISNFMQALHNACKDAPTPGSAFAISGTQIFSSAQVSAPPTSTSTPHSGGLGHKLVLVIALPVVFGTIALLTVGICCVWLVCSRRRRMKQSGNMDRFHAAHETWGPQSPTTPRSRNGQHGTYPSPRWQQSQHSPGFASQRNSGMGWAQPLSTNVNKRVSKSSGNSGGSYYEGWGNTFSPTSPKDWDAAGVHADHQLHERYFPPGNVTASFPEDVKNPNFESSPTDTKPKSTSSFPFVWPLRSSAPAPPATTKTQDFASLDFVAKAPPPLTTTYPPQTRTSPHQPPLNLQIPSPTATRGQTFTTTLSGHPDITSNSPEDYKNFSPYHDLSSPESAATDKGLLKNQTFVFDEGRGGWRRDDS